MSAPPELRLPPPERTPARAWVWSIALHGAGMAVLLALLAPTNRGPGGGPFLALRPPPPPLIVGYLILPPPPVRAPVGIPPVPSSRRQPGFVGAAETDASPVTREQAASDDSGMVATSARPGLASGVLWDRRVPPTFVNRSHAEMTDSAVEAMIQQYWDSLAKLPGGGQLLLPTWTATIGGQEFGLDQQWVTVAGVKVPAVLLGLIPIGVTGNQSEALDKVGQGREEDYQRSRAGQEAAADRREQIKALRERNQAEQDLRKKQGEAP